ncbi:FUSC family protein [Saccharopolyspora dendranthemae]|uniref:Aromatic acid exporter family member 1 n=1 Tax=Saccharopolyspora dendranthemae TaxID=1181886 RepID=A0A561U7U4_9PSEU|nr:aromatic acid exporter family protein [Saccharopolyspora dendranthemae]TWF95417.1 aromatic acid exporter family member 1 [Saccharopolyspora dendranthemae]
MTEPDQVESGGGARRNKTRARTRFHRLMCVLKRAFEHTGPDRDVLLLIIKSVIAATVAWVIANNLLRAPTATFAPFAALLMVQATISQSLDQSIRYAGAMVFGVLLAGLVTPVMGAATLTFAVLILVALVLGRWRKLGQQGPQVGVTALFAYASFTQGGTSPSGFVQLGSIAGLVLMGCVIGVVTNLVIAPPMRYRSARLGVSALAHSLREMLTDVAQGLDQGIPDQDQAETWLHQANRFPHAVAQASAAVSRAVEVRRFNPRRLFLAYPASFEGYRTIINTLERATGQLRLAMRGLTFAVQENTALQPERERFLRSYGEVLAATAEAAGAIGEMHSTDAADQADRLGDATARARRAYSELAEQAKSTELDGPGPWAVYRGLQTDAHRLVEEFVEAQHQLARLIDSSTGDSSQDESRRTCTARSTDALRR